MNSSSSSVFVRAAAMSALACLVALAVAGCSHQHATVAVVNIGTLEQRWPKFINYANQLQSNYNGIMAAKISPSERQRQLQQFQQQTQRWQNEVSDEVRGIVKDIAAQRGYTLVVTRQGVAFGGDDITEDVATALKIPPASPSPK